MVFQKILSTKICNSDLFCMTINRKTAIIELIKTFIATQARKDTQLLSPYCRCHEQFSSSSQQHQYSSLWSHIGRKTENCGNFNGNVDRSIDPEF